MLAPSPSRRSHALIHQSSWYSRPASGRGLPAPGRLSNSPRSCASRSWRSIGDSYPYPMPPSSLPSPRSWSCGCPYAAFALFVPTTTPRPRGKWLEGQGDVDERDVRVGVEEVRAGLAAHVEVDVPGSAQSGGELVIDAPAGPAERRTHRRRRRRAVVLAAAVDDREPGAVREHIRIGGRRHVRLERLA